MRISVKEWYCDMLHVRDEHPKMATNRRQCERLSGDYSTLVMEGEMADTGPIDLDLLRQIEPESFMDVLDVALEDGEHVLCWRITAGNKRRSVRLSPVDGPQRVVSTSKIDTVTTADRPSETL